ncbi:MAG: LptF/LptG family permease [Planctomycetota bacterium]|nr:MAG: LptF/LptG family permease [Planctomycetota bacterium]
MSTIDRYIIRTFFSSYVMLLAIGIGLYIVSDLLLNIDEFTEDASLPLSTVLFSIFDYYSSNLPLYYSQLGGPLMAIAASFTLGMMLRNNELVALVAAGMPLQRLLAPLLGCAVALIALWFINREVVMPPLAAKIARTHDDILGARAEGVLARDGRNVIVTALRLYPEQGRMERVFLIEPDERGVPSGLIEADVATYDEKSQSWRLERGFRYVSGASAAARPGIDKEPVHAYPLTLDPQELSLRRDSQWADYLSLSQLDSLLRAGNLPNWMSVNMSRHIRLTQPLLQLILLLLAIPFFLTREQPHVLVAAGRALLVAGAFFTITFVSQNIVKDVAYDTIIAWLPIMVFGPVATWQVLNIKT